MEPGVERRWGRYTDSRPSEAPDRPRGRHNTRSWDPALPRSIGLAFGCLPLRAQTPEPPVLVRGGKPQATIVLAATPRAAAQVAAFELQHHLRKMAGATVSLRNKSIHA